MRERPMRHDHPMTLHGPHSHVFACNSFVIPSWGTRKRLHGLCTVCALLSGWSGCRAVSAAVRPLCAVGLSGSCQAVTLGPDSDGAPRLSDSAVRLSDTCCQTVGESAVSAVRLSGTVRRCPGFAVRLSDQGPGAGLSSATGRDHALVSCFGCRSSTGIATRVRPGGRSAWYRTRLERRALTS